MVLVKHAKKPYYILKKKFFFDVRRKKTIESLASKSEVEAALDVALKIREI